MEKLMMKLEKHFDKIEKRFDVRMKASKRFFILSRLVHKATKRTAVFVSLF